MTFSASAVVRVEKKRREREYEELYKSARSPFKGMELKKIFLYSVAIGYYKNKRSPLEKPLHDLFQAARTLTPEEEWFIKSIAIKTAGDLSILSNERKVLNIAEEFANAGIMAGVSSVNFSKQPFEKYNGFFGASSTYAAFSYLEYGALRLFSQMTQDCQIKHGKTLYIAGHSGIETAEDSRTHFGVFAPGVSQLFPKGQVINLHPFLRFGILLIE